LIFASGIEVARPYYGLAHSETPSPSEPSPSFFLK
jgi:hypothetical protein